MLNPRLQPHHRDDKFLELIPREGSQCFRSPCVGVSNQRHHRGRAQLWLGSPDLLCKYCEISRLSEHSLCLELAALPCTKVFGEQRVKQDVDFEGVRQRGDVVPGAMRGSRFRPHSVQDASRLEPGYHSLQGFSEPNLSSLDLSDMEGGWSFTRSPIRHPPRSQSPPNDEHVKSC